MKVELKFITNLNMVVESCRKCYDSNWNSDSKWVLSKDLKNYNSTTFELGMKDRELIQKVLDSRHTSVLEHSLIHFDIEGLPRNILQEFRTHRVGVSYSVESSRFCLKKKLRDETSFYDCYAEETLKRAAKYIYLTGIEEIDIPNIQRLELLRIKVLENKIPNDVLKHLLPEVFLCNLRVSYNITSFRHFLNLRSNKDAHYIIRELSSMMFNPIPLDQKFLFRDVFHGQQ